VNLRVSLIAVGTVGMAVGLALAEPAESPAGKPFPAGVFELAAQAATQLPAARPPAPLATAKARHSPAIYPLLWGTDADRIQPLP
jgi:hypothetical protein